MTSQLDKTRPGVLSRGVDHLLHLSFSLPDLESDQDNGLARLSPGFQSFAREACYETT